MTYGRIRSQQLIRDQMETNPITNKLYGISLEVQENLHRNKGSQPLQPIVYFFKGKAILLLLIGICFSLMVNAQVSKSLNVTPGSLSSALNAKELSTITNLTLSGTIDGRDFITMRDEMPLLENLDLSGVAISTYIGSGGIIYIANAIPEFAFKNQNVTGNTNLKVVALPSTLISIGQGAFTNCRSLTSINIPAWVTSIGAFAFQNCSSLTTIDLPVWMSYIGEYAFSNCSALIHVDEKNPYFYSVDGILYQKDKPSLNLIRNGDFTNDLTSWDYWADNGIAGQIDPLVENGVVSMTTGLATDASSFRYQFYQTGLNAEPNVDYILTFKSWSNKSRSNVLVFEDTQNDYKRYGQSSDPQSIEGRSEWIYYTSTEPKLFTFHVLFDQLLPNTIQKIQWNLATADATTYLDDITLVSAENFFSLSDTYLSFSTNQVNMPGTKTSTSVSINSNKYWVVQSDQAWLTINPSNGIGNQTLTLSAMANPLFASRTATLTVSTIDRAMQTMTVTQESTTGIDPIVENQRLTLYPIPTSGKVKLVFDQIPKGGTYLTVTDVTGKVILKQLFQNKEEWIDLSGNTLGVYFIKTNLKNSKVQKVILK
jgi:hypothetical protein